MQTLGIILTVLGVLSLIVGVVLWDKTYAFGWFACGTISFCILLIIGGALINGTKSFVAEYPTSEYEMSYKYVMQDNATDTIIVIKEKEE